jgi:hypothetical protein
MQTMNRVFDERVISHGHGQFLLMMVLCVVSIFGGIRQIITYCSVAKALAEYQEAGNRHSVCAEEKSCALNHTANDLPAFNPSTSSICNIHLSNTYIEVLCSL